MWILLLLWQYSLVTYSLLGHHDYSDDYVHNNTATTSAMNPAATTTIKHWDPSNWHHWHQLGISTPAPPTHMSPRITDPCDQLWLVTCIDTATSAQLPQPWCWMHPTLPTYRKVGFTKPREMVCNLAFCSNISDAFAHFSYCLQWHCLQWCRLQWPHPQWPHIQYVNSIYLMLTPPLILVGWKWAFMVSVVLIIVLLLDRFH